MSVDVLTFVEQEATTRADVEKRLRGLRVRVALPNRARKYGSPLMADDFLPIVDVCTHYLLHELCSPEKHAEYLCDRARHDARRPRSGRRASRPADCARQVALYDALCIALPAMRGHATARGLLLEAYKRAFAAVIPLPAPRHLVLDIDDLLKVRRPDLPEGARAVLAYAIASAVASNKYATAATDSEAARRRLQEQRRRERLAKKKSPANRDACLLLFMP